MDASGSARFLVVSDSDDVAPMLAERYDSPEIINVGCGEDVTSGELAALVGDVVGFRGELVFDRSKPDGTPRKLLDVGRMTTLGWRPQTKLRDGIRATYDWYLKNAKQARAG